MMNTIPKRLAMMKHTNGLVSLQKYAFVASTFRMQVKAPYSDDEIGQFLMNWNNVRHHKFYRSLRDSYIQFGKLTDKQRQALSSAVQKHGYGLESPYRSAVVDPVHLALLTLSEEDFIALERDRGSETRALVASFQTQLKEKRWLSPKQLRSAASILNVLSSTSTHAQEKVQ